MSNNSSSISPSVLFNSTPGVPRAHPKSSNPSNPVVFLDITIADVPVGRITIELFHDLVPLTAENFRQFCTGEFRRFDEPAGYKNSIFHRIQPDFMIQGGDFINNDGSGCVSIYGEKFSDENFSLKHSRPGLVAMANSGENSNGCQFFILCKEAPWLDNKHVIFGEVIDGMLTVRKIESVALSPGTERPKLIVKIAECGEL